MWKAVLGLTGLCFGAVIGFLVGITAFWLAGVLPGAIAGALIVGGLGVVAGTVLDQRRRAESASRIRSTLTRVGLGLAVVLAIVMFGWGRMGIADMHPCPCSGK
jgi:hypothetical protein